MKGLVIVAHPDDETMFCGGTIAKFKWNWTVVSAAHSLDSPRGQEFAAACSVLGARPIMLGVGYQGKEATTPIDGTELGTRLLATVSLHEYDVVLTHNEDGEFGNKDHIVVNRVVRKLRNRGVWCFGFNQPVVDLAVKLDEKAREAKRAAMEQYRSQRDRIILVEVRDEETYRVYW